MMIDRTLILETVRVRLEPVRPEHLPGLAACANDPALWEFTFSGYPFANENDERAWFELATRDGTLTFVVIDKHTNAIIGSTRYFDIDDTHRKLEIGWTFIARAFWRTHVNTECKYLLFRHAFETWGANRVQLKGEAINLRSRAAMERIGATYEGTLRAFRVHASGAIRDTSFYSVIAPEWPAVRARLEELLGISRTESSITA
ncbi:MAG TPA: GNAT family protein [Candidatus Baltobacteraceae bacterium]|nr:GNAT family protein [Candidatus Baltobacteraceae bacterium]